MDADRARLWAVLREHNQQVCELGVCAVLLHEPCNVDLVLPPASSAKAPQPEIPLPDLTPIGKGQDADEATRARLLLRATIEKDKN